MRRFIYLDTDTINSYLAQIYDGLVKSAESEIQSSDSTEKQSQQVHVNLQHLTFTKYPKL